ncbi:MAG: L-aspartate oxidase [Candidatus Eiseniibacteriota bacterium]
MSARDSDLLILGSGIGGLFLALEAAETARVTVVTKKRDFDSNTNYAQGGMAVVLSDRDSFRLHVRDTLVAGAGLCHEDVVREVVADGPAALASLIELGVRFSRGQKGFELGREGGHSERRIVHAGDLTGREIERALVHAATTHPNITLLENHLAVDLLLESHLTLRSRVEGARARPRGRTRPDAVWGAYVLDRMTGRIHPFRARATVLATGGSGKVYLYTTNPDIATGDGVAMAWRAGAPVANLEFVQFHPTCLYHPRAKSFLISEAVRGEGAKLLTPLGDRFMPAYHKDAELAPRDVVARAIDAEMKKHGFDNVLLDFAPIGRGRIEKRFPNIVKRCRELGIDPVREPVPVVPAAHYQCGGVVAGLDGRTALGRLFAVGEVACTGLHGANRLASNSLLEAVVVARRTAAACAGVIRERAPFPAVPAWDARGTRRPREAIGKTHNWDAARRLMWDYVGIVRTDERLAKARRRLALIREEVEADYERHVLDPDLIEVRNLLQVAELIVRCAQARPESRGLHFNLDHPRKSARLRHDTVQRRERTKRQGGAKRRSGTKRRKART